VSRIAKLLLAAAIFVALLVVLSNIDSEKPLRPMEVPVKTDASSN
jgi:hypothetical protein